jgi:hypothetical protein
MTTAQRHRSKPAFQAMWRGGGGNRARVGDRTVDLEPEVLRWLEGLPTEQFAQAALYIDRLGQHGSLTRQLANKVGELRFYVGRDPYRVTYWAGPGQQIVLLTAFRKSRARDRREIERAVRALTRCVAERCVAEAVA